MQDIELTLPIYYKFPDKIAKKQTYKDKEKTIIKNKVGDLIKGKNQLVGLNWYSRAKEYEKNFMKDVYVDLIEKQFEEKLINKMLVDIKYKVYYKLYYSNPTSDMPNITSVMSKFLNDAIQELGLVKNDNVKFLVREVHEVVGEDKENPRCEIIIKEVKEW